MFVSSGYRLFIAVGCHISQVLGGPRYESDCRTWISPCFRNRQSLPRLTKFRSPTSDSIVTWTCLGHISKFYNRTEFSLHVRYNHTDLVNFWEVNFPWLSQKWQSRPKYWLDKFHLIMSLLSLVRRIRIKWNFRFYFWLECLQVNFLQCITLILEPFLVFRSSSCLYVSKLSHCCK